MTVKLSSLAVTANEQGDWEDCPTIPGISFCVRPINYPAFAIARDHWMQRLRRKHGESIPPDVSSAALGRLCAEHILLDWKGFDEPYTKERAAELLTNPEYQELTAGVIAAAIAASTAKLEYVEGAAKN
jgi:hypothetical protein